MKAALILALALAACAIETTADVSARHDAECRAYGLEPGTDGYGLCRLELAQERDRISREQAQRYLQGADHGM